MRVWKCKQVVDFDKSNTTVKEERNKTLLHQTKLSINFPFRYINDVNYEKANKDQKEWGCKRFTQTYVNYGTFCMTSEWSHEISYHFVSFYSHWYTWSQFPRQLLKTLLKEKQDNMHNIINLFCTKQKKFLKNYWISQSSDEQFISIFCEYMHYQCRTDCVPRPVVVDVVKNVST